MSVLLQFSMTPLDKGESVSKYVARSIEIIQKSGIPNKMNPMGTVIEGEWDEVMDVVRQCHERMGEDCVRITTSIKIDYRKGKGGRLSSKIKSVEQKLGREVDQ